MPKVYSLQGGFGGGGGGKVKAGKGKGRDVRGLTGMIQERDECTVRERLEKMTNNRNEKGDE